MTVRSPCVAGAFYPGSREGCVSALEACLSRPAPDLPPDGRVVGAAVPHAGWTFSGPTAGLAFRALLRGGAPTTVVLFGASHNPGVRRPSIMAEGAWETPMGEIAIDAALAAGILDAGAGAVVESAAAHDGEHSIEVQVPFIQHLFPEARIVPIIVPPFEGSADVGAAVAAAVGGAPGAVVVGSADLTHYGPRFGIVGHGAGAEANRWVKEVNDRRMVDLLVSRDGSAILPEARDRHNTCGGGSLTALVAAVTALGATEAVLLEQTTSYEVQPDPYGDTIVGYASVAYVAAAGG